MKTELVPVKYIETLHGGIANLFLFNDGKKYIVKFKSKRKGKREKEVVNEYIVAKLAEQLSLPTIPDTLVDISKSLMKKVPKNSNYVSGKQFAIPFIENCEVLGEIEDAPSKEEVLNRDNLTGMLLFDQWVNNIDRNRTNILFERRTNGYYVYMIDHGRCFPGSYQWSRKTLKEQPSYRTDMRPYKWLFTLVNNKDQLIPIVDKIMNLSDFIIDDIVQSIPSNWDVSDKEKEALSNFLIQHRKCLPDITDTILNRYSHLIRK